MGNYSSAAGKDKTQQCFPKDEGHALNLRTGQLKPFLPQGKLARDRASGPTGGLQCRALVHPLTLRQESC